MLKALARNGGAIAIRGAIAVVFGILTLLWPGGALNVFMFLFGLWAFADGVMALAWGLSGRTRGRGSRALIFEGVVAIAIALVVWIWPAGTAKLLIIVFAAWAVVTGIVELFLARLLWFLKVGWVLALGGIVSLVIGFLLLSRPYAGALAFVWLIGLYALAFGVLLIVSGLKLRAYSRRMDERFASWD